MKRNFIVIIVILMLIGYGVYDYYNGKSDKSSPSQEITENEVKVGIEKDQQAPNFELTDLEGNAVALSDYRGQKVLINFWATWCPPCRVEMPHMQRFYEDFNSEVVILAVNMTSIDKGMDAITPFIEEFGLTFPIVLDQEGDVMNTYQITAYPTTYAVDSQGVIRAKFIGPMNYETMKNIVEKM